MLEGPERNFIYVDFEGFFSLGSKGKVDLGRILGFEGVRMHEGREKFKRGRRGAGPKREEKRLFYSVEPALNRTRPSSTRPDQDKLVQMRLNQTRPG